jgi:hypothetical protein
MTGINCTHLKPSRLFLSSRLLRSSSHSFDYAREPGRFSPILRHRPYLSNPTDPYKTKFVPFTDVIKRGMGGQEELIGIETTGRIG